MNPYKDTNPVNKEASDGNTPTVRQADRDSSFSKPPHLLRPLAVCINGIKLIGEYSEKICIESCESKLLFTLCKLPLSGKELTGDIA